MADSSEITDTALEAELGLWLKEHWDPEATVAEWWEQMATAGWAAPSWPAAWYGKDVSPAEAVRIQQIIAEFGALGAPGGLGLLLAGPTIALHGTDEQRRRYLPRHRHRAAGMVPVVQRARCRIGPCRVDHVGRPRRRSVDRQRAEGMDLDRDDR